MDAVELLKCDGWCISEEGWNKITENGSITNRVIIERRALDMDLRELGGCSFPADAGRAKLDKLCGSFICQVQKIRNVSAPKNNEESKHCPRLLRIILTDGTHSLQAIENTKLNSISLNTAPGTKLRLKGEIEVVSSYLLLEDFNVECLGGTVTHLVDKWQLNRSLAKHTRGRYGVEGGPPPWIPFGQKITSLSISDKDFKSLGEQEKESKENDEFESSRRDAIAEAAAGKGFSRRVFGGGTKPLLDKNVQIILEEGFTLQQAEGALRQSRNDVKRALRTLQKKSGKVEEKSGGGRQEKEGGGGGGRRGKNKTDDEIPHKPSGPVSLFDYLEDKLPQPPVSTEKDRGDQGAQRGGRGAGRQYQNAGRQQPQAVGTAPHRKPREYGNSKAPRFQQQQQGGRSNSGGTLLSNLYGSGGGYNSNQSNTGYNSSQGGNTFNSTQRHDTSNSMYRSNPLSETIQHRNEMINERGRGPGEQRNQCRVQDIPEFPFKDSSFIPPLMSANTLGLFQDFNDFPRAEKWRWRVGDMCMAKYWEDNRYYNAEVTGVSDTTCVVRFTEYGNYEEVLHDDCLPITEEVNSNHISNSRDNENINHDNTFSSGGDRAPRRDNRRGGGGSSRYQAMYVPPPGRHHRKQ